MNDARQQMIERIGEDESLVGDLEGDAAEQLRQWANDTAFAIAQRADLDDDTVQQRIKAVRTAARKAATHDGDLMVAQRELDALTHGAHGSLIVSVGAEQSSAAAAPVSHSPTETMPTDHTTTERPTASANPSALLRLRGWWRGLWSQVSKEE
jgi:hypothetical protein